MKAFESEKTLEEIEAKRIGQTQDIFTTTFTIRQRLNLLKGVYILAIQKIAHRFHL